MARDNGRTATRPIDVRTFARAVAFLTQMAYQAQVDTSAEFPLPMITPSPDGAWISFGNAPVLNSSSTCPQP